MMTALALVTLSTLSAAELTPGRVLSAESGIHKEALAKELAAKLPTLKDCVALSANHGAGETGTEPAFNLSITASGKTEKPFEWGGRYDRDCVNEQLQAWTFDPKVVGTGRFVYTFTLKATKAQEDEVRARGRKDIEDFCAEWQKTPAKTRTEAWYQRRVKAPAKSVQTTQMRSVFQTLVLVNPEDAWLVLSDASKDWAFGAKCPLFPAEK